MKFPLRRVWIFYYIHGVRYRQGKYIHPQKKENGANQKQRRYDVTITMIRST